MKVVITPRGFARYGQEAAKTFKQHGIELDINDTGLPYSYEDFKEKAHDADGLIVGVDQVNEAFIQACPKVKVICKFGVGTDNIDVDFAEERGIRIGRTLGTNTNAVAEHVLALIFADAKRLVPAVMDVKAGGWNKPTGSELRGKTLGLIGFGEIGQRLAEMVKWLGMDVLFYDVQAFDPRVLDSLGVKGVSIDHLLEESDYVSLHVPLTEQTTHMISEDAFRKMKSSACLVNAARGGVVDEVALLHALETEEIRSAVFDVFSDEPPLAHKELLEREDFLLTPHTASRTAEAEKRTCEEATRIVCETLVGGVDK